MQPHTNFSKVGTLKWHTFNKTSNNRLDFYLFWCEGSTQILLPGYYYCSRHIIVQNKDEQQASLSQTGIRVMLIRSELLTRAKDQTEVMSLITAELR